MGVPTPAPEVWQLLASRKIYQYTEDDVQQFADTESASFSENFISWAAFMALLISALVVDFKFGGEADSGGSNKTAKGAANFKLAMMWTLAWVALAQVFAAGIYVYYGWGHTVIFLASYLLEKSLSLDNVFVFLMLFKTLKTPRNLQHGILNYGILLALVFRAAFIVAGTVLLHLFAWLMPALGLFLVWTAVKMLYEEEDDEGDVGDSDLDPDGAPPPLPDNAMVKLLAKVLPLTGRYDAEGRMIVWQPDAGASFLPAGGGAPKGGNTANLRPHASLQLVVLVAIAASDVVFAMDSIPAILSITTDPFLVITSNCFAVLGLRSLFFVLAALQQMFRYLQQALAIILAAVGGKMVLAYWEFHISVGWMLIFMLITLTIAIVASIANPPPKEKKDLHAPSRGASMGGANPSMSMHGGPPGGAPPGAPPRGAYAVQSAGVGQARPGIAGGPPNRDPALLLNSPTHNSSVSKRLSPTRASMNPGPGPQLDQI